MTSVDRTAYPRFGRVVSGRELADSFTPTDAGAERAQATCPFRREAQLSFAS